jgi:hypothetical protein
MATMPPGERGLARGRRTTWVLQPATVLGGMLMISMQLLRIAVWRTPGWWEFAEWTVAFLG